MRVWINDGGIKDDSTEDLNELTSENHEVKEDDQKEADMNDGSNVVTSVSVICLSGQVRHG